MSKTSFALNPRRSVLGLAGVAVGDLLLAVVLSTAVVLLVTGVIPSPGRHGGLLAAMSGMLLTVPVLWRRRAPFGAAATMAAGALINGYGFGPMVRCGPALPAVFFVAFAAGRKLGWRQGLPALGLLWLNDVVQALTDPNLSARLAPVFVLLSAAFFGAAQTLTSREAMVAALRVRNAELRLQREQTAALAVAADRERIAGDLNDLLNTRLGQLSSAAADGTAATTTAEAKDAFGRIESIGRQALGSMREVVGALQSDGAPTTPQPALAQLRDLVQRATTSDARLRIEGTPLALPAGLELSGYRVVEHLLSSMEDDPAARIDVVVRFTTDALELVVSGPVGQRYAPALRNARERVALHGGTLSAKTGRGQCEALVWLPLAPAHA